MLPSCDPSAKTDSPQLPCPMVLNSSPYQTNATPPPTTTSVYNTLPISTTYEYSISFILTSAKTPVASTTGPFSRLQTLPSTHATTKFLLDVKGITLPSTVLTPSSDKTNPSSTAFTSHDNLHNIDVPGVPPHRLHLKSDARHVDNKLKLFRRSRERSKGCRSRCVPKLSRHPSGTTE